MGGERMNQHINDMTPDQLRAACAYCLRVARDNDAPEQLRDEARDLVIAINLRLRELKAGAK
jgi:hypothetical protein